MAGSLSGSAAGQGTAALQVWNDHPSLDHRIWRAPGPSAPCKVIKAFLCRDKGPCRMAGSSLGSAAARDRSPPGSGNLTRLCSVESSEVKQRLIFERYRPFYRALIKQALRGSENISMTRFAGKRDVRRRQHSTDERLATELLCVREFLHNHLARFKKSANVFRVHVPMIDLPILGGSVSQKFFVLPAEGRGVYLPLIPDQSRPSAWPENPLEFRFRLSTVKPVKCLRAGDEVHRSIRQ